MRIDGDDHALPGKLLALLQLTSEPSSNQSTIMDPVGGQTNFGRCRPLSSHPNRAAVTRTQAVRQSAQQGDRCFPSDPDHNLEDHGCRPRTPAQIQQVGFLSVPGRLTQRGAVSETVPPVA